MTLNLDTTEDKTRLDTGILWHGHRKNSTARSCRTPGVSSFMTVAQVRLDAWSAGDLDPTDIVNPLRKMRRAHQALDTDWSSHPPMQQRIALQIALAL